MRKLLFLIVPLLMALTLLAACPQPEAGRTGEASLGSQRVAVKTILENSPEMAGRRVTLDVDFRGWTGICSSGPPVTRSDWMVEDRTGCIYVHGPLPDGLDPSMPKGESLTLTGVVRYFVLSRRSRPQEQSGRLNDAGSVVLSGLNERSAPGGLEAR